MYKTSINISKEQNPGITITHLLHFYKRELNHQKVSNASMNTNTLSFSNKINKFVIYRYANMFSSFSFGQIKIIPAEQEFIIQFEANMSRLFIYPGMIAGFMTILSLFTSGLTVFSLIMGVAVFALLTIVGYAYTIISFPIYFINLRNKIRQELAAMQQ